MGKVKLILILLVFITPFRFAQYFYMNNATDSRGTTNHGKFLDEEININLNNQDYSFNLEFEVLYERNI